MADLCKKFSEAVKMISFAEKPIQECVYCAFVDHLSDINTADLPEELQIFYESVKIRLTSVVKRLSISPRISHIWPMS